MRNFTELEAARKRLMIAEMELEVARHSWSPRSEVRAAMEAVEYWRGQCRALAMPDPVVVVVQQPAAPVTTDEFRPWAWFASHTRIPGTTMRSAAKPGRKRKCVRMRLDPNGEPLYSVEDARRNWPEMVGPKEG